MKQSASKAACMVPYMAMQKTTVYLPDDLKQSLERTAAEARRSEADIIREGVRLAIEASYPPQPHSGAYEGGSPDVSERANDLLVSFTSGRFVDRENDYFESFPPMRAPGDWATRHSKPSFFCFSDTYRFRPITK